MQTRKALAGLTNGQASGEHVDSPLAKNADKYLRQYDDTENGILVRQATVSGGKDLPFLNAIKKKIAKTISTPDNNLPVVASFDLYTGIKRLASRSLKDGGLKRLATHLERIWQSDPVGTLTYGQVRSLVSSYKDQYPKSMAADAIEAECSRVGMHKLPVAKLARIASKVDSQETYDQLMIDNGFSGNRPEQVKARAFVRGLVQINAGLDVNHGADTRDLRTVAERLGDKFAAMEHDAGYNEALDLLAESVQLANMLHENVLNSAHELQNDGISSSASQLDGLAKKLKAWMGALVGAQEAAAPKADAPDPTPEESAGTKRKWYDPRTWSYNDTSSLMSAAREASLVMDGDLETITSSFISKLGQVLPLTNDDEMLPHDDLMQPPANGPDMPMDQMPPPPGLEPQPIDQGNLDQGVDVLQEVEQAADDIIQQAPPEAMGYIDHEMAEGHLAPPGTAEWGAEEILNEGHTAPPPTDEWLNEEMDEMNKMTPTAQRYKNNPQPSMDAGQFRETHGVPNEFSYRPQVPLEDSGAVNVPDGMGNDLEPYLNDDPMGENNSLNQIQTELDSLDDFSNLEFSDSDLDSLKHADSHAGKAPPGMEDTVMKLKKQYPGEPEKAFATAWSIYNKNAKRGKGIPTPPGKPKSQPHVTTYAKVPEDGGKALKASEIEDSLLSGDTVKVGFISIYVNDDNEVELWNRSAGRACSIAHMDVAISDFINMVNHEISQRQAAKRAMSFTYRLAEIVNVPCEMCGTASVFPKTAKHDYRCNCGHIIKNASVEHLRKVIGQSQKAYQLNVQYPLTQVPQENKQRRDRIMRTLEALHGVAVNDEGKGYVVATISNTDELSLAKIQRQLQQLGGQVEAKRWADRRAQGVPPGPVAPATPEAPAAPKAPEAPAAPVGTSDSEPALPEMQFGDLANAAFMNYKAQGLSLPEAMKAFLSEHKERLGEWNPSNDGDLLGAVAANYTSSMPAVQAPAAQPAPVAPMVASKSAAEGKMKTPSVKKQKDHVSVPAKPLGKDTEGDKGIPTPGSVKSQNNIPDGKMSPKDLGKDSEGKDLLPSPKEKPRLKIKDPKGTSFADTNLGEDTEPNDNMKEPALGAKPSVSKSK